MKQEKKNYFIMTGANTGWLEYFDSFTGTLEEAKKYTEANVDMADYEGVFVCEVVAQGEPSPGIRWVK